MASNPWAILQGARDNAPDLGAIYMNTQRTRLEDLYRQKQFERQEVEWGRSDEEYADKQKVKKAYAEAFTPTVSSDPSKPSGGTSAATFRPDPAKLNALRATGPDGFKAASEIEKLGAEQLKVAQENVARMLDLKGRIIGGIRALPAEKRPAAYQAERASLIANGADPNTLPQQWDEGVADQMIRTAITAAQALEMDDRARAFAETVRHNRATEGMAAGNLEVARGNLKVREGALGAVKGGLADTPTNKILLDLGLGGN